MAKSKSLWHVRGNLGDVNFFEKNGKSFVRMTTSLDKSKIMSAPEFKRTRENMAEFGGSASIGKVFRSGMAVVASRMADKNLTARVTAVIRKVVSRGKGKRGQRGFELMLNKDLLKGLEFNPASPLDAVFHPPYTMTPNAARNEVVINLPDFNPDHYLSVPPSATHFRIVALATSMSDFQYNPTTEKYESVNSALDGLYAMDETGYLPASGAIGSTTTLTLTLPGSPTIPVTAGLVTTLGVEFYQFLNGDYYIFAQDNAMKVVDVF